MPDLLAINGYSYPSLATLCVAGVPTAGIYYDVPDSGVEPEAGAPNYRESKVQISGRDSTVVVRSGFSDLQLMPVNLVLVATLANLGSAKKSLLAGFMQLARYTVTMPDGDSYDGCGCRGLVSTPSRVSLSGGLIALTLPLAFEQLSTTN